MQGKLLLPAYYMPPISYFQAIVQQPDEIVIDQSEHYPKQTYRTRTRIGTANGILELFVPILHGRKTHIPMKDVKISDDHPWQRLHWQSIQTAYRSSAYFEYYEDDLNYFYENKFEYLVDYNAQQVKLFLKMLKIKREVSFSETFEPYNTEEIDYRRAIHPKQVLDIDSIKPYHQVFEDRQGFIPNLSILDLLCNQGPQSKNFL
ncbi:WbqC family protein [Sphingobacterium hungaricum]